MTHTPSVRCEDAPALAAGREAHPTLVILALALGGFAIGTTEFASMSLLPEFAPALGIDAPTAGHVISAYALGVVVGAPVIAVLAARIARRTLLVGLMVMFALGNLLSAIAPSYPAMLAFRFFAGLPHGAYFGVAMLLAASLVPREKRAGASAKVLTGLTIATVVGVPLANAIGQIFGWRWSFAIVAGLALLTAVLVRLHAPLGAPIQGASPLRELGALKRRQVWLTLGIGAIGFGGMFAVYTYLASTMLSITQTSPALIPVALAVFGLGLTLGNLGWAWVADRSGALMLSAGATLVWSTIALALYSSATANLWTLLPVVFLIGSGGGLATILQTRLMDVAEDAQTLAAALNHSAFNVANALGPWLAGLAIAAGYGLPATGWVGVALGGLVVWAVSLALDRNRVAA